MLNINNKEFLQNHLYLLDEIEGCTIKEVNETDTHFEFLYIKDDVIKSFVIACCGLHSKFSETEYLKFEVSTEPLSKHFKASSCNSMMTDYTLKPSKSFENLAKIIKIHFHTKEEAYYDTDSLVIEGENYDGEVLYYFVNIRLFESPVVVAKKYQFLSELGVQESIEKYGVTSFKDATDMLSQWYSCSFECEDGVSYNSVEQYMMAKKAKLFWDDKIYKKIMSATEVKSIKELGKKVDYFDEERWSEHREDIVYKANYLKFSQNRELKEFLLSTNKSMIVEINPNDIIWACGCFAKDAKNSEFWRGMNLLGQILMQVRKRLKDEEN